MDKEQAVFEQLTLSDFKKWRSGILEGALLKSEKNFGN